MSLEKIRELTERIATASDLRLPPYGPSQEYKCDEGEAICYLLFSDPEGRISVVDTHLTGEKGCIVPWHKHNVYEYILVYKGEIHSKTNGSIQLAKPGGMIVCVPGQRHELSTTEDNVRAIMVSIPTDKGYPRARR